MRILNFLLTAACVVALCACVPLETSEPQTSEPDTTVPAAEDADADSEGDPFAYCASVGTIDSPEWGAGEAWNPGVPEAVAVGLQEASGAGADAPLDPFVENSYWRCMDGEVYACFVGANLPCYAKADASTTPTDAMTEFCADQPDADAIPAAVTGRETVYAWSCVDGVPQAGDAFTEVDAQGYPVSFWYAVSPPQ